MSDAKFTPGPWHVVPDEDAVLYDMIVGTDPEYPDERLYVAEMHDDSDPKEAAANARLIAASPDAHAILAKLARWHAEGSAPIGYTMFDDAKTWGQVVNAYLAKVSGGTS